MDWSIFEHEPGRSLEQALIEDPEDREAWSVYADYVSGHEPLLAERIMLELQRDASGGEDYLRWQQRLDAFDLEARGKWLGPRLRKLFDNHKQTPPGVDLVWRRGFIDGLRIVGHALASQTTPKLVLERVLQSPISRFMSKLRLDLDERNRHEREAVASFIRAASPRQAMQELSLRDSRGCVRVDEVMAWAPSARGMVVEGQLDAGAGIRHEHLRQLRLSTHEAGFEETIEHPLELPQLRELELSRSAYRDRELLACIERMLAGARLERLERLRVQLDRSSRTDALLALLRVGGWLEQLRLLELGSLGEDPDQVMRVFEPSMPGRKYALRLRVSGHGLTKHHVERLASWGVELVVERFHDWQEGLAKMGPLQVAAGSWGDEA